MRYSCDIFRLNCDLEVKPIPYNDNWEKIDEMLTVRMIREAV